MREILLHGWCFFIYFLLEPDGLAPPQKKKKTLNTIYQIGIKCLSLYAITKLLPVNMFANTIAVS